MADLVRRLLDSIERRWSHIRFLKIIDMNVRKFDAVGCGKRLGLAHREEACSIFLMYGHLSMLIDIFGSRPSALGRIRKDNKKLFDLFSRGSFLLYEYLHLNNDPLMANISARVG